MSLNLEYYSGKDEYSDGDIENKIIDFIKKYPYDYEKAFSEDSSWPVLYHLSDMRKNVISWYPFKKECTILEVGAGMGAITDELCKHAKKVTSIELSKRRATAIDLRNKNNDNLEIIVGNYKDIELSEKFDYIILNGVFEYSALYMDTDNPFIDFLNSLKNNLKEDGKILIAIENKFGLKYWCGANEDHTGIPFDGLNNYSSGSEIRTFSKNELENIANEVGMHPNFYYMFPDYKFPQVIYTDESLEKSYFSYYNSYHSNTENVLANEILLYREVYNNNSIPFFANSFFIELSNSELSKDFIFVKYNNNYRKDEYNIFSCVTNDDKIYKKPLSILSKKHIDNILEINKIINNSKIKNINLQSDKSGIYSKYLDGKLLSDILQNYYSSNRYDLIIESFDRIKDIIVNTSGNKMSKCNKTIFEKYGIKLSKTDDDINYYSYCLIDITPNNIIVSEGKYYLFDQEWMECNVPIEYAMYRAIKTFFMDIDDTKKIKKKMYKKYNINEKLYKKLDDAFYKNIRKNGFNYYTKLYSNFAKIDGSDYMNILKMNDIVKQYQQQVMDRDFVITLNQKDIENRDEIIKNYQQQVVDRDDLIVKNQKDIENRDEIIKNYQQQVVDRDENIKILLEELNNIKNNKYWKIINKMRRNK